MQKSSLLRGTCLALVLSLSFSQFAFADDWVGNVTMDGKPAGATPPAPITDVAQIPPEDSTYHYQAEPYPGLDADFNPNPTITLTQFNELRQLDWYCAKKTDDISGRAHEMFRQGSGYGFFEGLLGMIGTLIGFGSHVSPWGYLASIGLSAAGGGAENASITFDESLNIAHAYCMMGQVKTAQQYNKLKDITIVPIYVGKSKLPPVAADPNGGPVSTNTVPPSESPASPIG